MKRVLLVDNNIVYRQVLALVLKWNTELKESAEADSLTQARRVLGNSNRKPDLAIVNVDAANADGVELMKELRTTAPDVPVLAITLRGDVDQRDRALRAGAGEVLTMASSPKEIVEAAKRLDGEQ
jgi:DNA-binding NarL/FixJ family response regulator